MPMLGMNQETGTLLRWIKHEGETVTKGEPLMEVATDKTDIEIEAPASGILRNVTAKEGDEVPVGKVIALIAGADEVLAAPKPSAAPAAKPAPVSAPAPAPAPAAKTAPAPAPTPAAAAPMSPVAARMVADHGIDASRIKPAQRREEAIT